MQHKPNTKRGRRRVASQPNTKTRRRRGAAQHNTTRRTRAAQSNTMRRRRTRGAQPNDVDEEEEDGTCGPTQRDEEYEEEDGACSLTQHDEDDKYDPAEQGHVALLHFFHWNFLYLEYVGPTPYVWNFNIFFSVHKLFIKYGFI